jgi:hypothetical protein
MSDLSLILSDELIRIAQELRKPNPPLAAIAEALDLLRLTAEMQGIELALFRGELTADEAHPRVEALLQRQHLMVPRQAGGRVQ